MKKIGEFIKESRTSQNISFSDLSKETKIKPEFLESLENEKWNELPEFPVVVGFVKNIAFALSINRDQAVALLKRDYPPKKLVINPKPDIKSGFQIGPKMILFIFVSLILLCLGGYLFYQYNIFISPPKLTIIAPTDNEVVNTNKLTVRGTTDSGVSVFVNNQPANVSDDGSFISEIEVINKTRDIEIRATSRSGKTTTIHRTILVDLKTK